MLAAGLGTRLRPLSDIRAKAALPVAGQPLAGRILRWLGRAGIRRVILNLHHRPETITRVVGEGADWGVDVRYSWEPTLLGSAGGPRQARPLLEADRFLIVNGDTLTNCDLRALVSQHVESGALVTAAVIPRRVNRAVIADIDGVVTGFGVGNEHFIGVQAVDGRVFDEVPEGTACESVKGLYPALIARAPGAIRVYRSAAEFLDVGTAADYLRTVRLIAAREHRPLDVGRGGVIDSTAHVEGSVLWDEVHVGAGAHLVDCVAADGAVIPAGARYARAVLVRAPGGLSVAPLDSRALAETGGGDAPDR